MRPTISLLLLVVLGSCATAVVPPCAAPAFVAEVDTLAFGTDRPDAPAVTLAEWERFLAAEVTPRFPDGLTWWVANGQWRGGNGAVVKEGSFVVQLVGSPASGRDAAIRAIVESYRTRFAQEAVMRMRESACVSF